MKKTVQLIFQAHHLKNIQRTGYQYLGAGSESVAEHSFTTTFIAFVLSEMAKNINTERLITMCLIHDLTEARVGDLNYFQKAYVTADEEKAMEDTLNGLPFNEKWKHLMDEFNEQKTMEAKLAYDADQLSLIVDLKHLMDTGYKTPEEWIENVTSRLKTADGKKIAKNIEKSHKDLWWREIFS